MKQKQNVCENLLTITVFQSTVKDVFFTER